MGILKYGKIVDFVHMLIESSYSGINGLRFVDATCGNGFDTLFLCNIAGESGKVYAFDIQDQAIDRTKSILKANICCNNYEIIKDSHDKINKYLSEEIDGAIFNLGYLPYSDKKITTKSDITIEAIKKILPILKKDGRIYITTYISHDTGEEIKEIENYLTGLNKSDYNVINTRIINKENLPPELFIIEKNA